jgi:hypothetical protein
MGVFERFPDSKKLGDKATEEFTVFYKNKGCTLIEANAERDIRDHIDFDISAKGKEVSVDFKAPKKIAKADEEPSRNRVPLEWTNVSGNKGWVRGKAEYIAFDMIDKYVWAKRIELEKLVSGVNWDSTVNPPPGPGTNRANYTSYQRFGRKDKICYVPLDDVETLSGTIIQDKNENKQL